MEIINIEKFFLNTLLRVSIIGVFLILVADLSINPEDTLSLSIDVVILLTCVGSYLIRIRYPTVAVLLLTGMLLLAMIYQSLEVPANTTTSFSIILVVGFIISVLLKRLTMWIMHAIAVSGIFFILGFQFINPALRFSPTTNDLTTIAITYSILYVILTYATYALKSSYDKIHQYLKDSNQELYQKANEIEAQNDKLLQVQNNLNALNADLENTVNERTGKIRAQNEILIKYSYTNAHHLRGPVARLLGLAAIYKLEANPDPDFFIGKMVDQVYEIDNVIQQINKDLEGAE